MHIPSQVVTQHAQALLRAAHLIEDARSVEELAWAVSNNLGLWLGLLTSARESAQISPRLASELSRAARTVIRETAASGRIAPCDTMLLPFAQMNRRLAAEISGQGVA